ncbi:MAG: ATP-binding cassette domain-containing protein [Leptospiraceae bacterium]|nr:ATP-binding cassette domain-containing protein [Leptospiraceae bacterium]MDW8307205.1 ATP-binding cassette domain-containing protein [Leptospiraceae bacterium]
MIRFSHLSKVFPVKKHKVHALYEVSFDVPLGKVTALVGESGSGKSTLARIFLGLYRPTAGYFAYNELMSPYMTAKDWRRLRRRVAMVFQDPYNSLNPRLNVEEIVREGLEIHRQEFQLKKKEMRERVVAVLEKVGLSSEALGKYPHEFSGGQRQRIGLARALILKPEVLVLDEPLSALDVSIQAQILNLLQVLKDEEQLTYLFITHDLSVVEYLADYVAVLYAGRLLEYRKARDFFLSPRHPYSLSLLEAIPSVEKLGQPFPAVRGEAPSPLEIAAGCPFASRCSRKLNICEKEFPQKETTKDGFYFCHNPL